MNNNNQSGSLALILIVSIFSMISCERPVIEPEVPDTSENPDAITNILPADRFVGTWVRYNETRKDTLRFSDEGVFVYTLGEDNGNIYTDQYFYESTDNFLLLFKDFSNYNHETHYIEFKESNTLLKIGNFTFLPVDVDVVYSVQFKKID